ncbi:hypothetical protein NCCP2716_23580 [Sporosarcina sp. NCCP-2716]|uniref:hypothetical protein n=1 Tax=Sporosarcina sp. NCCP-2716 TaxID=2943679 RepID=UPI00203DECAB|nr:hypothetical protein [Sporosarcina sp. NCCP-2716]GKV69860.1 hypothetical protein NCCP2716_23580 [Sporosarcina sp. NCCP-2716]
MAERYLFFNSTLNDRRRYQASDMADYWESFLSSGLVHENGQPQLAVNANGLNRNVTIPVGRAVMQGHLYINDADLHKRISDPDSLLDRIDRVILRYDNALETRSIKSFVLEGDASPSPEPPALTREGDVYEISLAQIRVVAGKSFIEQSDILDERLDESVCGLASSLVSVPTDIFFKEWNDWFSAIKDSTYVTTGEFKKSERALQKEVSNLNLQMEAAQRIKSGLTFGTDFDTSFGMDIDFTRSITTTVLEPGQTNLHVEIAEGFDVGQEVSIYDDVHLERRTIVEIRNQNLIIDRPLTHSYKVETNVARSMAVVDKFSKSLKFGVWGVYEPASFESKFSTLGNVIKSNVTDRPFEIANGKMMCMGRRDATNMSIHTKSIDQDNEAPWKEVFARPTSNDVNCRFVFLPYKKSVISFTRTGITDIIVHEIGVDGNLTVLANLRTTYAIFSLKVLEKDGVFYIFTCLGNQNYDARQTFMYKITYDEMKQTNGANTLLATPENILTSQTLAQVLNAGFCGDTIFVQVGGRFFFRKTSGVWEEIVGVAAARQRVVGTGIFGDKVYVLLEKDTSPFDLYSCYIQPNGFKSIPKLVAETEKGFAIEQVQSTVDLLGNCRFYYSRGNNSVFQRYIIVNPATDTISESLLNPLDSRLYYHSSDRMEMKTPVRIELTTLKGSWIYGKGKPLTENDIRFRFKETNEAVAWIEHSNSVSVTAGKFGPYPMDVTSVPGESQLVGHDVMTKHPELMLTMTRPSVDTDAEVTKILGGVE